MKRHILSIITLTLSVLNLNAQNVSVANATFTPGETKVISIYLNNTQSNIVSFQMDLTLPDGIILDKSDCRLSSRFIDNDQELTIGMLPNGDYRLTSTSLSLTPISGNSGEIIRLSLSATESAQGGEAMIRNIRFATSESERLTTTNVTFNLNVLYNLIYKVDGAVYKSLAIAFGSTITPESAPTKVGYTFSGWSEIPATMPNHDVVITGSFTINSYTLTYKVDDEEYKTLIVVYGTPITPEADPIKEGYTFSGWSAIPETMPAHDVTITGSFNVNSYILTYKVDGEVYKTLTVAYGTSLTPEPAPQKVGYTFTGWSEIPATMPAHDVTVTGSFSINSYTLTYLLNSAIYKTESVVYGTPLVPEPALNVEGHTFSGWSAIPETMPAHDVTITGTLTINSYTLTYLLNGEVYKTESVVYGTPLVPEPALDVEGHTFSGWSAIPETMPAHDVTVTGTLTINSYTLTYIIDGEEYITLTVNYGTPIIPEPIPQKEGYTFSGWSEIPNTMPAHDVTITGSFSINSYSLTYKVDGTEYKSLTIVFGTPITPETEPTKEGYTFSGWSEIPETMPAHDVIVTGSFSINSYTLTYLLNGEVYKTESVVYGKTLVPEPALNVEGYTFSGWSAIPETMPAHNVTVTGTLTINSYTLTYIVDGEEYKTTTVIYGTSITPETEPTKEGYTFSGWSEIPNTMPAYNVIIIGSFSINSYTLTYKVDGVEYKTSTIIYGTPITPEEEPTKEGYTFSGWSEIPEIMPAHNVIVTGSFSINSYILTYLVDGVEYKTSTIVYGTPITPEEEPTREGYTFSGWSYIPETMPAEDVTITGIFTINQYKLTYILEGKEYKSYKIDYNTPLTPEPVPTKKGMTFSGWGNMPRTMPAYDLTLSGTYSWSKEIIDGVIYQVTDTLSNYASVIGIENTNEEVTILNDVLIGEDVYTINSIVNGVLPKTTTINTSVGKLLLWLWNNGYKIIKETGSGRILSTPEIALLNTTASSLTLFYKNDYPELSETVVVSGSTVEKGENGYVIVLKGLEPDNLYEELASITLAIDDASYTKSFSFTTNALTFNSLQPKVVSLGNVIVAAESNLDDEEVNVGFEWRRTDWTDDFESRTGAAYLYEGIMEGYIRSLNTDRLWKFRPYYTSNAGNTYYGEWKGMDPSDYSYFEPTVHTYAPLAVTDCSADVKGYVMQGTDNVTRQGFMYWNTSSASSRRKVNGVPVDAAIMEVPGHVMKATLTDLDYDTEYCVVAFVKTGEAETFYGEKQTFRTTYDPDGINDVKATEEVTEVARYDLQGRMIAKPQKGINIIRYSNGTSKKVLVK